MSTTPTLPTLEAFRASHKAMLEILVQILEEVMYPIDKLIPEVESIIAIAEQLEKLSRRPVSHRRANERGVENGTKGATHGTGFAGEVLERVR